MRLERIAGARLTKDGGIVLTAGNFRTQEADTQGTPSTACPHDPAGRHRARRAQADAANLWLEAAAADRQNEARRSEDAGADAGGQRRLKDALEGLGGRIKRASGTKAAILSAIQASKKYYLSAPSFSAKGRRHVVDRL